MRAFTDLYLALDAASGMNARLDALVDYFRGAEPHDAAWAVALLSGRRFRRPVTRTELRRLVAEAAGLPPWLVSECHDVVGDSAESMALLLPDPPDDAAGATIGLAEIVGRTRDLGAMTEPDRAAMIARTWRELDRDQRFVWHKIMLSAFRVGVARKTVIKALAIVAGVEPGVMAGRLSGRWEPAAERYRAVLTGDGRADDAGRPYPFLLAPALEDDPAILGGPDAWAAEWKYDGVRAQLIRRGDLVRLWSRGEEIVTETYPEIAAAAGSLPDGTVLDGEILAWEAGAPLGFALLQRRLNRVRVEPSLWPEVPVTFMAFDLLEADGEDVRERPWSDRRARLESVVSSIAPADDALRLAPRVEIASWEALAALRTTSRERRVEGFMLKRRDAPYGVGRPRGLWWKWKVEPHTLDVVLLAAQRGRGRRAGLYTDFTFGVWDGDGLVPVTRAYSGLTDEEFERVNRFIRDATVARHGPVRAVRPELVFEVGFEGIQRSTRHKSGIALRFPRMLRWREDKTAGDADALETLERMLAAEEGGR